VKRAGEHHPPPLGPFGGLTADESIAKVRHQCVWYLRCPASATTQGRCSKSRTQIALDRHDGQSGSATLAGEPGD
jgi:hypothetical protein